MHQAYLLHRAGDEIARQIATVAAEVVHCARTWGTSQAASLPPTMRRQSMLAHLSPCGTATFQVRSSWLQSLSEAHLRGRVLAGTCSAQAAGFEAEALAPVLT